MAPKPLDVLRKGLERLQSDVKARKDSLLAQLANRRPITSQEEHWLDNDANLIDEECILEALEKASCYERGFERLDDEGKAIVTKLRELAGDLLPKASKKRKRADSKSKTQKLQTGSGRTAPPKKENATLEQRIEILDWYHENGKNQSATAKHFDKMYPNLRLKQPLISKWLKNEEYWRQQWADVGGESACKAKRIQQTLHPKITEMIELWVSKAMQARVLLTGEVLRQKWKQFAVLAGIPEDEWLKLSEGWLSRFKDRNGLKELKRYGEAASANPEHIVHERQRIQGLIQENGYHLKDVFNMDETGLFYALPPDRGLIDKKGPGVKGQKSRLTYAFTTNADGSEKLEPFIIGKAHKPRAFGKKTGSQLGFYYRNNAKAWMTGDLYQEWLRKWDRRLDQRTPPRKILLLQDNFSGHIIPEGLKNIRVENFRPNLTAHIQPLDQGIIRCFKAHYRAKYIERAIARYDEDITPSEIYDIDQLRAMRLANAAWQEVDTTTVRNCWHKSGILPDMDTATDTIHPSVPISALVHDTTQDPIARAEQQVNDALDVLVETGALQRSNQMDIDELLNPGDEMELIDETTDEEIFGAVMDLDTHEITLPAAGKDDADDSGPIKPPPTQSEALQAISLITDYIDSMDDPFARKLEGLLGNLSHRICIERSRAMKETVMTDYFHHL